MMKKSLLFVIALLFSSSLVKAQQAYIPVDAECKVHFTIKNFSIKVGGDFTGLKGIIKFDPAKYSVSSFDVTVDASTIDTDNSSRDSHLKKEEYFDTDTYKTIHFISTKIVKSTTEGRFYMYGELTIKGVTKPVEFGFGATPKSNGYVFDGAFLLNRRDFGVGGGSITMSDNLTVGLSVFVK